MHPLSQEQINNVKSHLLAGGSTQTIASQLGVSTASVSRIRAKYCPDVPLPIPGRPKKLTPRDVKHAVRLVTSGEVETAPEAARTLQDITNKDFSPATVRRELKKVGMKAVVKKKKPLLLKRHQKAGLDWAEAHKDWTIEDWKRVVWSDETKINRLGSDGRHWAWKRQGESLSNRLVEGTLKFGGGSMMIWGCMLWDGPGFSAKIDGRMDSELYCKILEEDLGASLRWYSKTAEEVLFQQDNDPKHTSRMAKKFLQEKGYEVMLWPAQSPDLNPIEHLWVHLKKQLGQYSNPPTSMQELWTRVESEWNKIEPSVCRNLIESMPRRVAAVLQAKGGYTKY
jgi:transposase